MRADDDNEYSRDDNARVDNSRANWYAELRRVADVSIDFSWQRRFATVHIKRCVSRRLVPCR
jgi:hypothetical protein